MFNNVSMLKKIIDKIKRNRLCMNASKCGLYYGSQSTNPWLIDLSTTTTVSRLKKIGVEVNSVIDVGASNGSWTEALMPYYPNAKYLLVEANSYHQEALNQFKKRNKNVELCFVAAAEKKDTICFDGSSPFGGLAFDHEVSGQGIIKVPSDTVDNLVDEYNLLPKYLLKLDTHGYEVPIFEGAKETLKNTNLIIVETYNFKLGEKGLKFYEMCKYMEEHGFSLADFSEPLWREKDGIFWQFDLFFIPSNSPSLSYSGYN